MCWWQPEAASGNTEVLSVPSSAETEQLCPGDGGRGSSGLVSTGSKEVRRGAQCAAGGRAGQGSWARPVAEPSAQLPFFLSSICLGESW